LLCLLDHLLAMAIHDTVFEAKTANNVHNIFHFLKHSRLPNNKHGILLRIEKQKRDIPVFRQPGHKRDDYRTLVREPLKAGTWLRYLKHLGRDAGLKDSVTQYVLRRGLVNAVNSELQSSRHNVGQQLINESRQSPPLRTRSDI